MLGDGELNKMELCRATALWMLGCSCASNGIVDHFTWQSVNQNYRNIWMTQRLQDVLTTSTVSHGMCQRKTLPKVWMKLDEFG